MSSDSTGTTARTSDDAVGEAARLWRDIALMTVLSGLVALTMIALLILALSVDVSPVLYFLEGGA